jgi:hypothetical protein
MRRKLNLQVRVLLHEIRTSNSIIILPETQTGLDAETHSTSATAEENMTVHSAVKHFFVTHGHLRPYVASLT